jgi:tight adherence protein B
MIFAALLAAAAIFLAVLTIGKSFTPEGEIGKKKEISKRIFEGPENTLRPEFTGLLRQDHLSDIPKIQQLLAKQSFTPQLSLWLKRSGSKLPLSSFLLIFASIGSVVFVMAQFWMPLTTSMLLGGVCLYFPFLYLKKKNTEYLAKFAEHLPDATSIISNNLKIGQSIENAMETVGKNAPFPLSVEFQTVCGEMKLGLPLETALHNLYSRMGSQELKIFVTGICLQQELGGNLSEIMDNLEKTIRERFALEREIKVLSAQGVMSMWVLVSLPLVFAGVWFFVDRPLLLEFSASEFGMRLIGFSFIIQMFAFYWMKKVVTIKD